MTEKQLAAIDVDWERRYFELATLVVSANTSLICGDENRAHKGLNDAVDLYSQNVKLDHVFVWNSGTQPGTLVQKQQADIGAGNKLQWSVDVDEVKAVVCDRIDRQDWLNARRLLEAVEMMVEKNQVVDAIRR